jgi:hypothetical protein
MALRTTGTTTVTRNARPAQLGPSLAQQHQAPTDAGQRGRDALSGPRWPAGVNQNMTSAAVTAATAKTSLQITCPRRGPEPAAITAKTARMGLEITAAVCALLPTRIDHAARQRVPGLGKLIADSRAFVGGASDVVMYARGRRWKARSTSDVMRVPARLRDRARPCTR